MVFLIIFRINGYNRTKIVKKDERAKSKEQRVALKMRNEQLEITSVLFKLIE